MRTILRVLRAGFLLCLLSVAVVAALAAEPQAPAPAGDSALAALQPLLDLLGGHSGKLVQLVALMGSLRLVFKFISAPVQNFFERALARVVETSDHADDHFAEYVLNSRTYRVLAFVVDMVTSLKLPLVLPTHPTTGEVTSSGARITSWIGVLFLALAVTGCGTKRPPGQIISFTQRVIGIDASENAVNQTPQLRLGFVSTTYHVVPTATNIMAPPVSSSIDLSHKPFATGINEQFSTGAAAK